MRKILIADPVIPLITEELSRLGFDCLFFRGGGKESLKDAVSGCEGIIVRSRTHVDREVILSAPSLRFIARVGAGMENIDSDVAAARGIACLNSPEGNRGAVAEHALGMLLSLLNHLNRADRQVRAGRWLREENRGTEIQGKTVGIIGYGNMGGAFARRLAGFSAEVISYDKYKTGYSDAFTREVTLGEIFSRADIVSLHVPLTPETRHMVDDTFLSRFRKKIWLINTSRGPVVDTSALVRHLAGGNLLGAALDVLEYEDGSFEKLTTSLPVEMKALLEADNVILSPHIAGWTKESEIKMARVLVEKIGALGSPAG